MAFIYGDHPAVNETSAASIKATPLPDPPKAAVDAEVAVIKANNKLDEEAKKKESWEWFKNRKRKDGLMKRKSNEEMPRSNRRNKQPSFFTLSFI